MDFGNSDTVAPSYLHDWSTHVRAFSFLELLFGFQQKLWQEISSDVNICPAKNDACNREKMPSTTSHRHPSSGNYSENSFLAPDSFKLGIGYHYTYYWVRVAW